MVHIMDCYIINTVSVRKINTVNIFLLMVHYVDLIMFI